MIRFFWAEAVGTFSLVLCGTGAIILGDYSDGAINNFLTAIAFGMIVYFMITAFRRISGAHINPAVTVGFAMTHLFENKKIFAYVSGQLFGALLASVLLYVLFPKHPTLGATIPKISIAATFVTEFVLSFILMYSILWISQHRKWQQYTAMVVGIVVFLEAYFAGPFTGASMNPARSIAPAIISGQTEGLWIYIVSTMMGMLVAGILWAKRRRRFIS